MRTLLLAAIISLFLISCTKRLPEELNESYMLCVNQVKGTVNISVTVNPANYLRMSSVVTEFGDKKMDHKIFIWPGETVVQKSFDEKAMLTKYYVVTLMKYGE